MYDNTHSRQVARGDSFIYLDKRGGAYAFLGHGAITRIRQRRPDPAEQRNARITTIYGAVLADFVGYAKPLDIRIRTLEGRQNRARLGISDVNRLGMSRSVAKLPGDLFGEIVDLAYEGEYAVPSHQPSSGFSVPDIWSYCRRRDKIEHFKREVLRRQNHTCAVCGTRVRELLDVAHVSDYSTDPDNRANPANGICLCVYCHRAYDRGLFLLDDAGNLTPARNAMDDAVAKFHFSHLSTGSRRQLLRGVDAKLLTRRGSS